MLHFHDMHYKARKHGCDLFTKYLSAVSPLRLNGFPSNSTPRTFRACVTNRVSLRSVNYRLNCNWRAKKLIYLISGSIGGKLKLKLYTLHFPHLLHKWYKFGWVRSINKITLLGEQSTCSTVSRLP